MYSREMKIKDISKQNRQISHHPTAQEKEPRFVETIEINANAYDDQTNQEIQNKFPVKVRYSISDGKECYELLVTREQGNEVVEAYRRLSDDLGISESGLTLVSIATSRTHKSYLFKINGTNTYIKGTLELTPVKESTKKRLAKIIDQDTFFDVAEYVLSNRE